MSQFDDCIRSAQRQGMLSEDEADGLISRYEEHRQARAAAGDRDPEGAAKTALIGEKEQLAAIQKAIATGQAEAAGRIKQFAGDFRDLSGKPNVFEAFTNLIESKMGGTTSWRYRAEARIGLAHAEVADFLSNFRRRFLSLTGERMNRPKIDDVAREMLGQSTGSAEAKGMADAMAGTFERGRQDFNRAAGFEAIGKLDYGYLPQHHSPAALLGVPGKTAAEKFAYWRDRELPRLDLDKMTDPLTGGPLNKQRLDEALRVSWGHIVTGGWSDRKPGAAPMGVGALAKQRSEHRFLHYKTPDDWLASDKEFGSGDPLKAMFQHIRSMETDIAAMETFGPNPNATLDWMKQVVQSEVAKSITGQPSLHAGKANEDTGKRLAGKLQGLFDSVRGPEIISTRLANGFANVSNVLTSAYLGATSILAASTDPFIDRSARAFNGLPAAKAMWGIFHAMNARQSREQMVRSGLGLDDFLHISGSEARYAGTLAGSEWSKNLADRAVTWNGLNAITQARKHRFGGDFQAMAADHVGDTWAELGADNAYFRRTLEKYGFAEKDWNALRKTEPFIPTEGSAGFLQPADVKNRDLGVRYLAMILGETERAVPTSTAASKAPITGNLQRGTLWGELINSGLQFKSFTLSFTTAQWQAINIEARGGSTAGNVARGAAYVGALFVPLTLGGALSIQINNVTNGKDLQPMDPSTGQGLKFWMQAMFKGGGLGIIGDFIFSDLTRFGHTPAEQIVGPTISLGSDAVALAVGTVQKELTGQKTHFGRELVRKIARTVPIISSHPLTRAAYQRIIVDQLQYLTDPDAHKFFREQQQKLHRETGQQYYWRPGATSPDRAPDWPSARK